MFRKSALILFFLFLSHVTTAIEVPRSEVIISIGGNRLSMKAANDSSIHGFRLNYPGFYAKVSGENYINASNFIHVDLNMSFNRAIMEHGYARTSRLNFNYGFGKMYERVKLSVSPGLCYCQMAYQNDALNKGVTETRFAPSLGFQTDLILFKTEYQYLALFVEGSAMFAKPSRWVHQVSAGICWKPSFRKKEPDMVMPQ